MYQEIYELQQQKKLPKFDKLDVHSFIWLPLKSVPINEHYPINSMRQPALKIFNLLTWTAVAPLATDEQKFMHGLALKHEEMGYFLIHHNEIFGIIGVTEYHNGRMPGRAVVFNGIEKSPYHQSGEVVPTMLDLVYSELEFPCRTFIYSPGKMSNYDSVYYRNWGRESLDDD